MAPAAPIPVLDPPGAAVTGLGRGMAWSYLQLASSAIAGLVTTGLVLRRLGAADFGVFALVTAVTAFVTTMDAGLGLTVIRASARQRTARTDDERAEAQRELAATHAVYAVVGAVAVTSMAVVGFVLPALLGVTGSRQTAVRFTTLLVGLGLGLSLGTSTLAGLANGRRDFRVLAVATLTGSALGLAVIVTLVDRVGLVSLGWAEVATVAGGRAVLCAWARRHAPWFRVRPSRPASVDARRVVAAALPLVALGIGGQVIATADLFLLGGFYSASIVGLYKVGSLVPTQAIGVLYQAYDVSLPALAGTRDHVEQERVVGFLTRVACFLGGLGLMTMAMLRVDIVTVLSGRSSSVATTVLVLFCGSWMVTTVAHGLGLLLIARGRQRVFLWPVVAEVILNVALTVVLIQTVGAIGAAVATLVTLGVSHTVVLPFIARRELTGSARRLIAIDGWLPLLLGVALAAATFLATASLAPSPSRIALTGALAALIGVTSGTLLIGPAGRRQLRGLLFRPAPAQG